MYKGICFCGLRFDFNDSRLQNALNHLRLRFMEEQEYGTSIAHIGQIVVHQHLIDFSFIHTLDDIHCNRVVVHIVKLIHS